jgi:hypothetical protein
MYSTGWLFLALGLLAGCGGPSGPVAGGTDVGNPALAKVRGVMVDTAGIPQVRVRVRLLPNSFNPLRDGWSGDTLLDTTDAQGTYEILAGPGVYTLTGIHLDQNLRAFRTPVSTLLSQAADLGRDTLSAPGAVRLAIDSLGQDSGFFYIPGTDLYVRAERAGTTVLGSVPSGRVDVQYYAPRLDSTRSLGIYYTGIPVRPRDTTAVTDTAMLRALTLAGGGLQAEFASFTFAAYDRSGLIISLAGTGGADSLIINCPWSAAAVNTPIRLANPALEVRAILDSGRVRATNQEGGGEGFVRGSLVFTALDTAGVITGYLEYASSLQGTDTLSGSRFYMGISGRFTAMRQR